VFKQTIFVGRSTFPPTYRTMRRVHEEMQRPPSYAWFCPECAEIWARALVEGSSFQVITYPCEQHRDRFVGILVSGSILLPFDLEFNDSLPVEAWRREVIIHANMIERLYHE